MRCKIIVKIDGAYFDSFWYQGSGSCRAISRAIWRELGLYNLDHERTTFVAVTAHGKRVSVDCMLEPRELDSEVE